MRQYISYFPLKSIQSECIYLHSPWQQLQEIIRSRIENNSFDTESIQISPCSSTLQNGREMSIINISEHPSLISAQSFTTNPFPNFSKKKPFVKNKTSQVDYILQNFKYNNKCLNESKFWLFAADNKEYIKI